MSVERNITNGPQILFSPPTDRDPNGHKDPGQQSLNGKGYQATQEQLLLLYNGVKKPANADLKSTEMQEGAMYDLRGGNHTSISGLQAKTIIEEMAHAREEKKLAKKGRK